MSARLTVQGITSEPSALERTLVSGLGAVSRGVTASGDAVYALANGWLSTRAGPEPGWRAVQASFQVNDMPPRRCEVVALPVGTGRPPAALGPPGLAIDHVAIAVDELDAAVPAVIELLGAPGDEPEAWEFPDLGSVAVAIPCDGGYVELNEPLGTEGLIASAARDGRPVAFVCLRVPKLTAALARLEAAGVPFVEPRRVRAHDRRDPRRSRIVGQLTVISRKATGGLRLMVLEPEDDQ